MNQWAYEPSEWDEMVRLGLVPTADLFSSPIATTANMGHQIEGDAGGRTALAQAARDDLAYADYVATWQDAPYVGPQEQAQRAGEYSTAVETQEAIAAQMPNPTMGRSGWGVDRQAPLGSLRATGIDTGAISGDYSSVFNPLNIAIEPLEPVQEWVGNAGATLLEGLATGRQAQNMGQLGSSGWKDTGSAGEAGRWLGEAFVPTTVGGLALEALPGIGMIPGTASMLRGLGSEAAEAGAKAVTGYGARALGAGDAVVPTGAAQRTIAPATPLTEFERRFHQTSPENAAAIDAEGFRLDMRGSGDSDILPVGVNTKSSAAPIPLRSEGAQVQTFVPTSLRSKVFESRATAEAYLKQDPQFSDLAAQIDFLDSDVVRKVDALDEQWKALAQTPGASRADLRVILDQQKALLDEAQDQMRQLARLAQRRATEVLQSQGYDGMDIARDVGGIFGNNVTDNRIIFDTRNAIPESRLATANPSTQGLPRMPRVVSPTEGEGLLPTGGGAPRNPDQGALPMRVMRASESPTPPAGYSVVQRNGETFYVQVGKRKPAQVDALIDNYVRQVEVASGIGRVGGEDVQRVVNAGSGNPASTGGAEPAIRNMEAPQPTSEELALWPTSRVATAWNDANSFTAYTYADELRRRGVDPLSVAPDVQVGRMTGRTLGAPKDIPPPAGVAPATPAADVPGRAELPAPGSPAPAASSPPVGQGAVPPPASAAGAGSPSPRRTWAEIEEEQRANRFTPGNINPSGPPPTSVMDAPPPPGPPPTPPTGTGGADEFAANIRLSKYPEDLRDTISQWANDNPDAVQAARRGTIPDAEVQASARSLVEDMGGNFDKLQKGWKPGEAWNAEEIAAIRGTLSERTQAVIDAARLPDSTENQLKLAEAILEQQRVQQIVHGVTTEAGRALRAFRTQADAALTAGDVREARELLQRAIGTSEPEKVAMLAKSLEALNDIDPAKANKMLRDIHKPDFWDKVHWYWMNSILSGPVTQGRNIMGNMGTTMYTPFQRIGSAALEQPLAAIQGRQAERFWQEAPAFVVGMLRGIPEGINGAITTAKTGISPRAAAKMEVRPQPIGGIAGRVIGIPTTGLGMADEFFSAINYRASLHADAVRMARMEGLKGTALTDRIASLVADPPPALMKSATGKAEDLVFRGDPGELARAAAFLRQKTPGGRYIMPFLNTPAALLKYGIKNSPLGLLDRGAWQKALAGNPEGADELSRAFMGSSIAAGLSTLVATGAIDITAAAPVNSAERDRFFREGKMPFSVKIPGVGWVEYKQLPMFDTTFTLVASVVDGVRRGEDVQGIASQAAANVATNLLDKSYMSGIGDLFDAVQDPMRYAERYATRQASGLLPFSGATRQSAGFFDQTIRDPQSPLETAMTQIPGLSKEVPARLNAFGEDAKKGLPSPIQVREAKQSDVDAVLEELGMEVGFVGDSIGGQKLSRENQHLYQQIAGQLVYGDLVDLIAAEAWAKADNAEKAEMLEKTVNSARTEVRKAFTAVLKGSAVP